ncbi:member of Set1p complex, histone methyl transferase, partial [Ascosphaera atra]
AFRSSSARVEKHPAITALDFDDQGDYLVSSSTDETLLIYDVKEGQISKTVPSKKYGCHLARFTHHSRQLLYASTKVDDSLRLLDLHTESYLRYFPGHEGKVTNVAVAPGNDGVLSCGRDDMVMLWDLNSRNPQGKLKLAAPYLAAFDPSGYVFAIASQATASVLLYDYRNFDKPPFATFDCASYEERYFNPAAPTSVQANMGRSSKTNGNGRSAWTKLEFSNDGKYILLSNDWGGHYILDAFDGNLKAFLVGKLGHTGRRLAPSTSPIASSKGEVPVGQGDTCFTPDGRYVIGGSAGAPSSTPSSPSSSHASASEPPELLVWDLQQQPDANLMLRPTFKLPSAAPGGSAGGAAPARVGRPVVTAMNPRYNMLATADREVVFWVPEEGAGGSGGGAAGSAGAGPGGNTPASAGTSA